jgi:enamine deaminase RidA (YjgF/YER057c/UK114 family)
LWATLENEHDVGFAVVQALSGLGSLARQETLRPQAQTRAAELARGRPSGGFSSGSSARIAYVPLIDSPLLDALALDKPALGDEIADLARSHRLIPHSIGITSRVSRAGVSLQQTSSYTNDLGAILVGADGVVVCSGNVGGDDQFSGMRVDPTRLQEAITQAGQFALAVWERIDTRQDVQRVAVAVAIPEAQNKVFGHSTGRNSISMGGSGRLQEVVVPDPPAIVRRSEIGSSELTLRLVAEVRRAFADAGAVEA